MAHEESHDASSGHQAAHLNGGNAPILVPSPNLSPEDQAMHNDHTSAIAMAVAAASTQGSAQGTEGPGQNLPPHRPLWDTPEGRVAGFKRMLESNKWPDHRDNLEAFIKYYGDGGKVPEGDEEVWAIEGQVSFGERPYNRPDLFPEGWFHMRRWRDVCCPCPCRYSSQVDYSWDLSC